MSELIMNNRLVKVPNISHQTIKVYYAKGFSLFLNFRTSYINVALDIGLIDEVNDEIQELEKKLNVHVSQVLSDKERPRSTAETLSPATMKGESLTLHKNLKSTCICSPVKVY